MKRLILAIVAAVVMALTASADSVPTFPGGQSALDKYLTSNLIYPASAIDNGIEGVVNVAFTVNPDGSIGTIKILTYIDPDLEQEAIRLVKNMPAWNPATSGEIPVAGQTQVAIKFILPQ